MEDLAVHNLPLLAEDSISTDTKDVEGQASLAWVNGLPGGTPLLCMDGSNIEQGITASA